MGAPKGNRNSAKGKYPRRVISLSGPEYDAAMDRLVRRGNTNPTDKEIVKEMSDLYWSQFGITYDISSEEDAAIMEKSALAAIRKDYLWIKECEDMSLDDLRKMACFLPSSSQYEMKRSRQAQIVLETREKGKKE